MSFAMLWKRCFGGYNNFKGEKVANKILAIKVQNPFDPTTTCTMGDLLIAGAITEDHILDVAKSYGIDFPSDAVDGSSNNVLQYMLYHGKDYQYTITNEAGEKIIAGLDQSGPIDLVTKEFPLLPIEHVEKMADILSSNGEIWNSTFGQVSEFAVKNKLIDSGYDVLMPAARNYKNADLLVDHKYFVDHELNYVESPDYPGYGMLQIKSTSDIIPTNNYVANTLHHLEVNPDIPVLCSTKIADQLGPAYADRVASFESIGLNDNTLESMAYAQYEQLTYCSPDILSSLNGVAYGLDSSQFSDAVDSARTSVISHTMDANGVLETHLNIGLHNLPIIGMMMRGAISCVSNYRRYQSGEIPKEAIVKNITYDVARTGFTGTAAAVGVGSILAVGGTSFSSVMNNAFEALSGDDLTDIIETLGIGALVVAAGVAISKVAGSIFDNFFDPKKKLKQKTSEASIAATKLAITLDLTYGRDNFLNIFKHEAIPNIEHVIDDSNKDMAIIKKDNKIYPLSYYVHKYRVNIFSKIRSHLIEPYEKMCFMWRYIGETVQFLCINDTDTNKQRQKKSHMENSKKYYCQYLKEANSEEAQKMAEIFKEIGDSYNKFTEIMNRLIMCDMLKLRDVIKNIDDADVQTRYTNFITSYNEMMLERNRLIKNGTISA